MSRVRHDKNGILRFGKSDNTYLTQCWNCLNNNRETFLFVHCASEGKMMKSELKKQHYCAAQDIKDWNK